MILRMRAQTRAMTMRIAPIFQNDDPVFLFTAHSIGKAWHKAIISANIEACFIVSGIDIIAAIPAYVPAVAPEMKATADSPGNPKCTNSGFIHVAIHASTPKCCMIVTDNDMGIISLSSHLVLFHEVGKASLKQSKILSIAYNTFFCPRSFSLWHSAG